MTFFVPGETANSQRSSQKGPFEVSILQWISRMGMKPAINANSRKFRLVEDTLTHFIVGVKEAREPPLVNLSREVMQLDVSLD
jgi:hypothetical protein